jgi:tetratricopeptide (TPR) repeat protein
MVEIDKILSERSDERILKAVSEISEQEFNRLVEKVLGYLELKVQRSRTRGTFVIADCLHRPDGKKYVVFFSRRDETISRSDIESLVSYMSRTESPNGLILTTSVIEPDGAKHAESSSVGLADGSKLAALLRRFDLDKEVVRSADMRKEQSRLGPTISGDKRLQEIMSEGYEALADKDFMKALDAFDRAILLDEAYDVPWRMKGNTLDEMGYHEQALECYRHALELFPESDETWFSLGNSFFALSRYTEELMCYDRALLYSPTMQKALINRGSTLHRLGRFKEALDTYDRVLKINYRLEKVHNNRGATLHSLARGEEALDSYSRAIELKHDYVEAWMNKGSLLYEMGRYEEALEAFTQMTQIRPELPKSWYLKGLTARKLGKVTHAKAAFEQAIRLDPEFAEAKRALEEESKKMAERFVEVPRIVQDIFTSESAKAQERVLAAPSKEMLSEDAVARVKEESVEQLVEEVYGDKAALLILLDRLDEALVFLSKSLRIEGDNAQLLTMTANALYLHGKKEIAVSTYEHALSSDPAFAPALLNLHAALSTWNEPERLARVNDMIRKTGVGWQARALTGLEASKKKDYKQALEDVDVAIALENLAMLTNFKGLLRLEFADLEGATDSFGRTQAMPFDRSEGHNNLGVVLLRMGERETSGLEFDRAIKEQRNNPAAWNNRGCVLYRSDRYREAIACFDESLVIVPTTVSMTNKGFCQLALDNVPEALHSFEQSIKVAETPEAYNNEGIALQRLGRVNEAQVSFREALRLAPQFKDALANAKMMAKGTPERETASAPPVPAGAAPELVGSKESSTVSLESMSENYLTGRRKSELEAVCASLGISPRGTKSELIARIMAMKNQADRK